VKQKQSQKVVINIGDTKPKRRAPRRKAAPRGGAPPRPGGGGGGAAPGGAPAMPGDFFPRGPPTVILPNRAGPIAEPISQIQQLIRPIEQTLLRLEQAARPPPPPQPLPYVPREELLTMRQVRDYMAQYIDSLEVAPDPKFVSSSSSAEKPRIELIEEAKYPASQSGTQFVVDQPQQPLISAEPIPLVDSVKPIQQEKAAQPAVSAPPKKVEIDEEEDDEFTLSQRSGETRPQWIQRLRDDGEFTASYLKTLHATKPDEYGLSLATILTGLGVKPDRTKLKKDEAIKQIRELVTNPKK
jgi:hypothetical protein